jgi:hypothetical protein
MTGKGTNCMEGEVMLKGGATVIQPISYYNRKQISLIKRETFLKRIVTPETESTFLVEYWEMPWACSNSVNVNIWNRVDFSVYFLLISELPYS